mmetsp:Transcript_15176/g.18476  ORF Transcript_15176/g.18476 Transcript_15176/m.18476 type:complete len:103 (+) Transcript_15176:147-455(+)
MCDICRQVYIISCPNKETTDALIKDLRISKNETQHSFCLRDEGAVGDFLGIRIDKQANNSFLLSQSGLINKVLKEADMEDENSVTPALTTAIGSDKDSATYS